MKKTIIYASFALLTFVNAAVASNNQNNPSDFGLVGEVKVTTPLGIAISKGDVETARKFIEYGANVNETSNGMTPLMIAARYNNTEVIKLLLEKGANVKAKDDKGMTALKYAELSKANDAVQLLKAALK